MYVAGTIKSLHALNCALKAHCKAHIRGVGLSRVGKTFVHIFFLFFPPVAINNSYITEQQHIQYSETQFYYTHRIASNLLLRSTITMNQSTLTIE